MKLRLARRALAEAKRLKTWWRENRPAAPDLFEEERIAALDRIAVKPNIGALYEQGDLGVPVRRVERPQRWPRGDAAPFLAPTKDLPSPEGAEIQLDGVERNGAHRLRSGEDVEDAIASRVLLENLESASF